MTNDQKIINNKLGLLKLAEKIACWVLRGGSWSNLASLLDIKSCYLHLNESLSSQIGLISFDKKMLGKPIAGNPHDVV
jgi:hypothetical protein